MKNGDIRRRRFPKRGKKRGFLLKTSVPAQTVNLGIISMREKKIFHMRSRISDSISSMKCGNKLINPHFWLTLLI